MGMNNATPKNNTVSQSTKKVLKVLEDFMYSKFFVNEIKSLREQYGIPKNGFPETGDEKMKFSKNPLLFIPEEMKTSDTLKNNEMSRSITKAININIICEHIYPKNTYTASVIKYYLFFNQISFDWNNDVIDTYDKFGLQEVIDFNYWEKEGIENKMNTFTEKPVGILLNPEITKNDLLDFIKKNFEAEIKPLLQYYQKKSLYKNVKVKNNPVTNKIKEVISKSSDKTTAEISKELAKEKIVIDKQHIVKTRRELGKKY